MYFQKRKEKKREKKEKRKPLNKHGGAACQGFFKKYYPTKEGGDFLKNPKGLTFTGCPECLTCFPFLFFKYLVYLEAHYRYCQKKVSHLKRQLTNRELQPQELNRNQRNGTTDIRKVNANRTTFVGNQPPASQPTAKNTAIHNACMPQAEGQRCKGRPKNTLFVLTFWFSGKRKRKIF